MNTADIVAAEVHARFRRRDASALIIPGSTTVR
jgi:hypothetical protein